MREAGARVAASFGEGDIVDDDDLPVHDVPLASSAAQIDAELAGDLDDDLESPGDVELDDEAAREGLAEYEPEPDEMDLPPSPSPTPDAPPAKPKRKRVVDTPQQRFMQHLYDLYGKAGKTLAYYQRHDTFWVRRPEPMMAMRKPTHIDWEPACLYDVGLWDAEALCQYYCPGRTQRFRCPRNPAHEMARARASLRLHCSLTRTEASDAAPSKPYGRRCLEERRDYYLFGWRRRCEHCYKESGHYTSCSDFSDHIMRQLPEIVQLLFPAILTARAAIDKGLITLICKGAAGGFGPTRIAAYLCERATLEHAHLEEAYLTLWLLRKVESTSAAGRAPTSFPSFDDRKTYNGVRTTAGYIVAVWLAWMDAHKVYIDRFIAAASGRVLKADHHMKARCCEFVRGLTRLSRRIDRQVHQEDWRRPRLCRPLHGPQRIRSDPRHVADRDEDARRARAAHRGAPRRPGGARPPAALCMVHGQRPRCVGALERMLIEVQRVAQPSVRSSSRSRPR
jgi:hypothetical protein